MMMLQQCTAYGMDRSVRIDALRALSRGWKTNDKLIDYYIELLNDPSMPIRRTVIDVLGNLGNEKAITPLQHIVETETESRITAGARDAITKIQEAQKKSH